VTSFCHEDIRGLDVAVYDPSGVGGVESVSHLDAKRQHIVDLHRLAAKALQERRLIHAAKGRDPLTIVWRLSKK
jgi:hypothetical protein